MNGTFRDLIAGRRAVTSVELLWLVLAIAAALRLWGIAYGLPHVYWTDEYHEVMRAMELGAGGFNLERTGKGGFYLLLFFEYGLYFAWLKLTGAIAGTREFAELFVTDPSVFYLSGRITAALIGCATVAFACFVGRRAYSAAAGVLAALFMAVNVVHTDLSHRVGVDVPMTFFAAIAIYYGIRIAESGRRRDYLLAAVAAALATTTKLPGIVVLLPLLIAHGFHAGRSRATVSQWLLSPALWLAFGLFLVVWILTNPGILLAGDFFALFAPGDAAPPDEVVDGATRPDLWSYYAAVLRDSMGWPLFLASLAGAAFALWRRTAADWMLLAFGAVNYVAISSTTSEFLYFPRYALPIIFVLGVLAARLVAEAAERLPARRAGFLVLAACVLCAGPLLRSASFSVSLTRDDTRTLAKAWIDAHVPPGSRVLIEGTKIAASRLSVPLEDTRAVLRRRIAYWKSAEPRQAKYLDLKLAVHAGGGYDLELVKVKSMEQLPVYLDRGVRWFVIRPDYFIGSRKAASASAELVADLRRNDRVRLRFRAVPDDGHRQGPAIEVYEYAGRTEPES